MIKTPYERLDYCEAMNRISHELKTPVTAVKLELQLAKRKLDTKKTRTETEQEIFERLNSALGRLETLMERIGVSVMILGS